MKRKPNYKFKSEVLKTGICKDVLSYDLLDANTDFLNIIDIEENYNKVLWKYGLSFIKEARRINKATSKRKKRLEERIRSYLEKGTCIFATLTFSDDVLNVTSVDSRRKYVSRYLKTQSDYYLANIDFGNDDKYTHREHYHAIIVSEKIDTTFWNDNFGFTWVERIKNHQLSDKKLAKYVSKLTNHAIKDSTKRQCYIYSRCK